MIGLTIDLARMHVPRNYDTHQGSNVEMTTKCTIVRHLGPMCTHTYDMVPTHMSEATKPISTFLLPPTFYKQCYILKFEMVS